VGIGVAFALALVLGHWISLVGIFWLTATLAVGGMLILALVVPIPDRSSVHRDAEPVASQLGRMLKVRELVRLDLGVLILHMVMTSLFLVIPLVIGEAGSGRRPPLVGLFAGAALVLGAMVPFIISGGGERPHEAGVSGGGAGPVLGVRRVVS